MNYLEDRIIVDDISEEANLAKFLAGKVAENLKSKALSIYNKLLI